MYNFMTMQSRLGTGVVYPEKRRKQSTDSFTSATIMSSGGLQDEFQDQFDDVVTRLTSKNLFQSEWDIASFAVFFIFIGMILLLVLLVLIRCCCCCCCDDEKPRRHRIGIDNMAMEP